MIVPGGIPGGRPNSSDFGWRNPGPRVPIGSTEGRLQPWTGDSPMGRMIGPAQSFAGGPGGTTPQGGGQMNSGFGHGGGGTFGEGGGWNEPGPLPGAGGGGGGIPGAGEPGGLGGPPIGGGGSDPFGGAHAGGGMIGGNAQGFHGFGWRQVGNGQVFGNAQPSGTPLAYPTGSYWDPDLGWVAQGQSVSGFNPNPSQAFANELGLAGQQGFGGWNPAMRLT